MKTLSYISQEEFSKWVDGEKTNLTNEDVKQFISELAKIYRKKTDSRLRPQLISNELTRTIDSISDIHAEYGTTTSTRDPEYQALTKPSANATSEQGSTQSQPSQPSQPQKQESNTSLFEESETRKGQLMLTSDIFNIIWLYGKQRGADLKASKLNMIMYIIYGSWLATKGSRVPSVDVPSVGMYGPFFWEGYYHNSAGSEERCQRSRNDLMSINPEFVAFVEKKTDMVMFTPMVDLNKSYINAKGSPFDKALKTQSSDKKKYLSETDMTEWFRNRMITLN